MAFWGVALKPNKPEKVSAPEGEILHLSQGCLHQPTAGKNYVQAKVDGKTYTIACLEKDKEEHTSFDLFFSAEECVLTNKGASEVHLTGYFEPKSMSDEDEPAATAKASKTSPVQAPKLSPVVGAKASPKIEVKAAPKTSPKTSPKATPKAVPQPEEEDDSEIDGEEGEEEEDGLEDSEEEELEEEEAPASKKRKGETTSTAPAKKQKSDEPTGGNSAYVGQVLAFLKKSGGKANLGDIGTKCPKPKELPGKLKAFLEGHKDKFVVEANGTVKAK